MRKRDSRMSLPAARHAVRPARPAALPARLARCLTRSVRNVESPRRFLLSRRKIALFTAASALPPAADDQRRDRSPEKQSLFRAFFRLILFEKQRMGCDQKRQAVLIEDRFQIFSKKGVSSSLRSTPSLKCSGVGTVIIYFRISSIRTLSRKVTREKLTPCLWARPVRPIRCR